MTTRTLYHGTTTSALAGLASGFTTRLCEEGHETLTESRAMAENLARQRAAARGGDPVVLTLQVDDDDLYLPGYFRWNDAEDAMTYAIRRPLPASAIVAVTPVGKTAKTAADLTEFYLPGAQRLSGEQFEEFCQRVLDEQIGRKVKIDFDLLYAPSRNGGVLAEASWDPDRKRAYIAWSVFGLNDIIALHECAHVLAGYRGQDDDHGPVWQAIFRGLLGQYAPSIHIGVRREGMPSWRDRGAVPQEDIVIKPDTGMGARRLFEVILSGQTEARFPTMAGAKDFVRTIYGDVDWRRVPGDQTPHDDPTWGATREFNDSRYYLVADAPRLAPNVARVAATVWYHAGDATHFAPHEFVHLGTRGAAMDRRDLYPTRGLYEISIAPAHPLGSPTAPLTDKQANTLVLWATAHPGVAPASEQQAQAFDHESASSGAYGLALWDVIAQTGWTPAVDALYYENFMEDAGSVSVAVLPSAITSVREVIGEQEPLWGSNDQFGFAAAQVASGATQHTGVGYVDPATLTDRQRNTYMSEGDVLRQRQHRLYDSFAQFEDEARKVLQAEGCLNADALEAIQSGFAGASAAYFRIETGGAGPFPTIQVGMFMCNEVTMLHECAHLLIGQHLAPGTQLEDGGHTQAWLDTFNRLVGRYGSAGLKSVWPAAGLQVTSSVEDYGGQHQPSNPDEYGQWADDMLNDSMIPADWPQHPEWYTGFPQWAGPVVRALLAVQGKPTAPLTIYRATPGEVTSIERGNWVTLSRAYAQEHLDSNGAPGWHILSATVPAHTVGFGGDDLMEWGYWGPDLGGTVVVARLGRALLGTVGHGSARHGNGLAPDSAHVVGSGAGAKTATIDWGAYEDGSYVARGFKMDVSSGHLAKAFIDGTVTAQQIVDAAHTLTGAVGGWWGVLDRNTDRNFGLADIADFSYTEDTLRELQEQGMADSIVHGEVMIVLIGRRPTMPDGQPWDPTEHNPIDPLMGNSYLKEHFDHVDLVEILYNAGWGWKTLPAPGIRVKASTAEIPWSQVVGDNDGFRLNGGQVEEYIQEKMGVDPRDLVWTLEGFPLSDMTTDPNGVRSKASMEWARQRYESGQPVPPIVAIEHDGVMEHVDGWHRLGGAAEAGLDEVPAYVGRRRLTMTAAAPPVKVYRGLPITLDAKDPRTKDLLRALAQGATNAATDRLWQMMAEGTGTDRWTGKPDGPHSGMGTWWTTNKDDAGTYSMGDTVIEGDAFTASVLLYAEIDDSVEHAENNTGSWYYHVDPGTPLVVTRMDAELPTAEQARRLLDALDKQGGWFDPDGMGDPTTWVKPGTDPDEEWVIQTQTYQMLNRRIPTEAARHTAGGPLPEHMRILYSDWAGSQHTVTAVIPTSKTDLAKWPTMDLMPALMWEYAIGIGTLYWHIDSGVGEDGIPFEAGEIAKIEVQPGYRHRGVATALWNEARRIDPRVHHSSVRSDEGEGWAHAVSPGVAPRAYDWDSSGQGEIRPVTAARDLTLYRGLHVEVQVEPGDTAASFQSRVQDAVLNGGSYFQSQFRQGIGVHWTTDKSVTDWFSAPYYKGPVKPTFVSGGLMVPILITAIASSADIDEDLKSTSNPWEENEYRLKPGAPLRIQGIQAMLPDDLQGVLDRVQDGDYTQPLVAAPWVPLTGALQAVASENSTSAMVLQAEASSVSAYRGILLHKYDTQWSSLSADASDQEIAALIQPTTRTLSGGWMGAYWTTDKALAEQFALGVNNGSWGWGFGNPAPEAVGVVLEAVRKTNPAFSNDFTWSTENTVAPPTPETTERLLVHVYRANPQDSSRPIYVRTFELPRGLWKTASGNSTSAMVALVPPLDVARLLVDDDQVTEPLDNQHVTVVYLGKTADLDHGLLLETVEQWAAEHEPVVGTVRGYGTFDNDDEHVLYAAWAFEGGNGWRQDLVDTLGAVGIKDASSFADQEWTPHETLAYSSEPVTTLPPLPQGLPERVVFGSIVVAYGDDWSSFALGTI